MYSLTFSIVDFNVLKLDEDIRATIGTKVVGVNSGPGFVTVYLETEPTEEETDLITSILDAHDPSVLTDEQILQQAVEETENNAISIAESIPGWATWDLDTTLNYIDTNLTDLASAKVIISAMAKMMIALRNKTWPNLEN